MMMRKLEAENMILVSILLNCYFNLIYILRPWISIIITIVSVTIRLFIGLIPPTTVISAHQDLQSRPTDRPSYDTPEVQVKIVLEFWKLIRIKLKELDI